MPSDNLPNFSGKIVGIYFNDQNINWLLENPYFETQGGRLFLVGRCPDHYTLWAHGSPTAIAWDRVLGYNVFDTIEDYVQREGSVNTKPQSLIEKWFRT